MNLKLPKQIRFKGDLYDVPSPEELHEWDIDGGCETPDHDWVERDHPDGWFRLLGLI